jgi:hypothetical protein
MILLANAIELVYALLLHKELNKERLIMIQLSTAYFKKYSSVYLTRRLDFLARNFDVEIFLNLKNHQRFHRVIEIQNMQWKIKIQFI